MSGTIVFSEDFETGPNATTIDTSNTGFIVLYAGPATVTFDNSRAASGVYSADAGTVGTGVAQLLHILEAPEDIVYIRWAMYVTTLPSDPLVQIFGSLGSSNGGVAVYLNSSGQLVLADNDSTPTILASTTTANTIPLSQWFVVEVSISNSGSLSTLRLYSDRFGSPIETISCVYDQDNTVSVGLILQATDNPFECSFDSYADAYDDWVGPLIPPTPPITAWLKA